MVGSGGGMMVGVGGTEWVWVGITVGVGGTEWVGGCGRDRVGVGRDNSECGRGQSNT